MKYNHKTTTEMMSFMGLDNYGKKGERSVSRSLKKVQGECLYKRNIEENKIKCSCWKGRSRLRTDSKGEKNLRGRGSKMVLISPKVEG